MIWVTFDFYPKDILLSAGAVFIISSKTKDEYGFIIKMVSKVKGCGPSTEDQWNVFDSKFMSSLCTNAPKPSLVLIWVWWNLPQIYCFKLCLDFLWRLMNLIQVVGSPSCIFHVIVPNEVGNNPLEYVEVQILDSLYARMRQQPEDVDKVQVTNLKNLPKVQLFFILKQKKVTCDTTSEVAW